jgi:tRNA (guanine10-N2)-methyltransferase
MKYLATFIFNNNFYNFCLPELISIAELYNLKNFTYNKDTFSYNIQKEPYITISFDGVENPDLCKKLIERCTLLKNIIKVYGEGSSMDEVIDDIEKNNMKEFKDEVESLKSFRFDIDFRGKCETRDIELEMINKFDKFGFKAKVDIKKAERIFVIFRNSVENQKTKEIISTKYYFGIEMAGKDEKKLHFYTKYVLTKRKYIGPTATDHLLSFLMANFAQIKEGQMVIDPFVGTGSLLIPPSHYKALCFGCDLDVRVLRGYSVGYTRKSEEDKTPQKKQGNIFSNFDDYNFPRPQIIRQDINKPAFRKKNLFFDAIICDPPYGWRAGVRKTGLTSNKKEKREKRLEKKRQKNKDKNKENNDIKDDKDDKDNKDDDNNNDNENDKDDINNEDMNFFYFEKDGEKKMFLPTSHTSVNNIFDGLINFAIDNLKIGGFLVCLFPVRKEKEEEDLVNHPINFPMHPQFKLVQACENINSRLRSRWCLTYRKIS